MSALFLLSYSVLWLISVITLLAVILLFRQFGLLTMSPRQRIGLGGISLGSRLPSVSVGLQGDEAGHDSSSPGRTNGTSDEIWSYGRSSANFSTIVLGAPECPICKQLWPAVHHLPARRPESNWIWIDGATRTDAVPTGWTYAVSPDLDVHRLYQIPMMPFAYVVDRSSGKVITKGLVNRQEDIVDLLEEAIVATAYHNQGATGSLATRS